MRKKKNYYSPSAYDVHRNAVKARKNSLEEVRENTDNIDVLVMEINRENKRHLKTDKPTAPVNAKKEPKAINIRKEHKSVYDEIAERRKKEKQLENLNNEKAFQEIYSNKSDVSVQKSPEKSNEIFSHSPNFQYSDDSDFDVVQDYELKKKGHTKLWVILITILSLMCIGVGGLYAYQQGVFNSLLQYFGL